MRTTISLSGAISLLAGAILTGSVPASAKPRLAPEQRLAQAVEGRDRGEAVKCIALHRADHGQVIRDTAILYRSGSTLYVNRPRSGADSLNEWDILLTRTFSSRLCSGDVVEMIDSTTGSMRGLVFLGDFVPYKRPR